MQLPYRRLLKMVIISVLQWVALQLERWECLLAACYISILQAAEFMAVILKDTSFQKKKERQGKRVRVFLTQKQISLWLHIISCALSLVVAYSFMAEYPETITSKIILINCVGGKWDLWRLSLWRADLLAGRGVCDHRWDRPSGSVLWREAAEAYLDAPWTDS